jgi:hypothetical protein
MSTHTLQPLIWLARSWTRPIVLGGTPLFSVIVFRSNKDCIAAGKIITGFFIRACIIASSFFLESE